MKKLKYTKSELKTIYDSWLKNIGTGPFHFTIGLTTKCNCQCKMCEIWKENEELDREFIENLIIKLKSMGLKWLTLSGGEPFLYKDLPRLLKLCTKLSIDVSIITNGILLKDRLDILREKSLKQINISLDSINPQVHDFLRGVKITDIVKENLINLSRIKNKLGIKLDINAIVCKKNLTSWKDLIIFVKDNDLNSISFSKIRTNIKELNISEKTYIQTLEKIQKFARNNNIEKYINNMLITFEIANAKNQKFCFYPFIFCGVRSNGDIYTCCKEYGPSYKYSIKLANIRENNFEDIWNSDKLKAYRKKIKFYKSKQCNSCLSKYRYINEQIADLLGLLI